jgi:hypothetical protein
MRRADLSTLYPTTPFSHVPLTSPPVIPYAEPTKDKSDDGMASMFAMLKLGLSD